MSELLCNSIVALLACSIWVFLLCSSPFMAAGICEDTKCAEILPQRMISTANLAATLGRFLGLKVAKTPYMLLLVAESLTLAGSGVAVILASVASVATLPMGMALVSGLSMAGGITLWSNFLLMRNDHSAQAACNHSVYMPCHITTEIMWLAIQVGSICGTFGAAAL